MPSLRSIVATVRRQTIAPTALIRLVSHSCGCVEYRVWGVENTPTKCAQRLLISLLAAKTTRSSVLALAGLCGVGIVSAGLVHAQSIRPANDGTGTVVTPSNNRFDITGGTLSGDRASLFHSFSEFGLSQNQIANFIANPSILNILSRVTGGNPSVISGLLQVSGSKANLFLVNPAGIVFGVGASLNVPGSFMATTATGTAFGGNQFSAVGANNYQALVGTPGDLIFAIAQPGAIVNLGNLTVNQGQTLMLAGGTVLSTGNLSAPGGQVIVAAVPGSSRLRISQLGSPLSLEIQTIATEPLTLSPLSLSQLLTGGMVGNATEITNQNGQIQLSGSGISVNQGDVVTKGATAGTALLSANHNLTLVESQLQTLGDLTLFAKNSLQIRDSVAHPFLAQAGGNLTIQGNQTIDILALKHPQVPFQSGGNLSLISNGVISGDAHFTSRGSFSLLTLSGQPGHFVSLYDPVISANGDVTFGNYTGTSLKVEATGSITAGNITITGPDTQTALSSSDPDSALLRNYTAVVLRAGVSSLLNTAQVPQSAGGTTFQGTGSVTTPGTITTGDLTTAASDRGRITLSASGTINTGNRVAGTVDISTGQSFQTTASLISQNDSSVNLLGGAVVRGATTAQPPGGPLAFSAGMGSMNGGVVAPGAGGSILGMAPTSPPGTGNMTNAAAPSNGTPNSTPSNGTSGNGTPGNGTPGNGTPGNGTSGNDAPGSGAPGNGTSGRSSSKTAVNTGVLGGNLGGVRPGSDLKLGTSETNLIKKFSDYFGREVASRPFSSENISETLKTVTQQTGTRSAVVYVFSHEDQLELVVFTQSGQPISKVIPHLTHTALVQLARRFLSEVADPRKAGTAHYLPLAQQLYQDLIAPIEAELAAQNVNTLLFAMDSGLRGIPLAALHDGKQFLVEKYSLALIPSISLTDTRYQSLKNVRVLAMGASTFKSLPSLPAVPAELLTITQELGQGRSFLNESFTLENLKAQRRQESYAIIHLATHGEFQTGASRNSYIQFWDQPLRLDQLRQLGLNDPPVELLVLSACRTATGDEQAELGFAGIAFSAGVKSVLASLWYVSDEGTLGLMSAFYKHLKTAPTKAEALREAQIAMIKGELRPELVALRSVGDRASLPTASTLPHQRKALKHPFYWAAFTMIGSPW